MDTGTADTTQKKLSDIIKQAEIHQKAVEKMGAENPDSTFVETYRKKWDDYNKRATEMNKKAQENGWVFGRVSEDDADDLAREFALLLAEFRLLNLRVNNSKSDLKVKALEELTRAQGKTPVTQAPFATEHIKTVVSDAMAPPVAPPQPITLPSFVLPSLPGAGDAIPPAAKIGVGVFLLLGLLYSVRKLLGG